MTNPTSVYRSAWPRIAQCTPVLHPDDDQLCNIQLPVQCYHHHDNIHCGLGGIQQVFFYFIFYFLFFICNKMYAGIYSKLLIL